MISTNFIFIKLSVVYYYKVNMLKISGTLNAIFLRNKLIDKILIVVTPTLIGGKIPPL